MKIKKFLIIILTSCFVFLFSFFPANKEVSASATFSFGGKIEATKVSMVTCTGSGTLVVLTSTFTALTTSALKSYFTSKSEENSTQKTVNEISDLITGLYGTIPFYAKDSSKSPRVGGQILGKADVFPDFKTCKIQIGPYKKPFPVRTTDNYNVSR